MRRRTVAALAVILLAVGGIAGYTALSTHQSTPSLSVAWVSSPPPDLAGNHHSPDAIAVTNRTYVAVPLNSRQATHCSLTVLDGEGDTRWTHVIPPRSCTVHAVSDPYIADADGDGAPEILAATSAQKLRVFGLDGDIERTHNLSAAGYSAPLVGNVTGTAHPETVVVDLNGSISVLGPVGDVWTAQVGDARVRHPSLADVDGGGGPELVVGQLLGTVTVLDADGQVRWERTIREATAVRWLVTADTIPDPGVEIVVTTFSGSVLTLDGDTDTVEWRTDFETTGVTVHAVGDGDGDGRAEVYVAGRDGVVRSLDGVTGDEEWSTTITTEPVAPMPPPSLGDLDGDGDPELVAPSNTGSVTVLDPASGDVLATYHRDVPINTFVRVTDSDGDGIDELIVIYGDGRVVTLEYTA